LDDENGSTLSDEYSVQQSINMSIPYVIRHADANAKHKGSLPSRAPSEKAGGSRITNQRVIDINTQQPLMLNK
jgi:hypothetical protein